MVASCLIIFRISAYLSDPGSCVGAGGFDQGQPGYLYTMKIHNDGEISGGNAE